jgi:hexosaminidase
MSWRGIKGGIAAATSGHDVVMSPTSHCYLDYYQSRDTAKEPEAIGGYLPLKRVYEYEPVPDPEQLDPSQAKHILGAQGNIWTEYIHDYAHVQYMALPRAIALAEVVWSPREGKDYGDFLERLQSHLGHLDAAEINYRALDSEPTVIGAWKSDEPTEAWTVREWEITEHLKEAGKFEVTFLYTGGSCRLDVQWAEIAVNGKCVARDAHWGTTGGRHEQNVYTLEVGELPADARITLRAQIRSDGGTDSNGEIHLSRAD